jgi:hypothetical protein
MVVSGPVTPPRPDFLGAVGEVLRDRVVQGHLGLDEGRPDRGTDEVDQVDVAFTELQLLDHTIRAAVDSVLETLTILSFLEY